MSVNMEEKLWLVRGLQEVLPNCMPLAKNNESDGQGRPTILTDCVKKDVIYAMTNDVYKKTSEVNVTVTHSKQKNTHSCDLFSSN